MSEAGCWTIKAVSQLTYGHASHMLGVEAPIRRHHGWSQEKY